MSNRRPMAMLAVLTVLSTVVWLLVIWRFQQPVAQADAPPIATRHRGPILTPNPPVETLPVIPDTVRNPFLPAAGPGVKRSKHDRPRDTVPPERYLALLSDRGDTVALVADSAGTVRIVRSGEVVGGLRIGTIREDVLMGHTPDQIWRLYRNGSPPRVLAP